MDGVVGIYSPGDPEIVRKGFWATTAVGHRGRASGGMAISYGGKVRVRSGLSERGLHEVCDEDWLGTVQDLSPNGVIGNVGYTKSHRPVSRNAEPLSIHPRQDGRLRVCVAMDGYLLQPDDLRAELEPQYDIRTHNNTEVVGALLHRYLSESGVTFEAGKRLVDKLHGRSTFALVALVNDGKDTYLIALNDDRAFEPFCHGKIGDAYVISSESVSHRALGGSIESFVDYNGAEMTICSPDGIETQRLRYETIMPDIFQGVYFGHVSSHFRGREIFKIRRDLGESLVDLHGIDGLIPDLVAPNPDSGWGVTMGVFAGMVAKLDDLTYDRSREHEGVLLIKDKVAYGQLQRLSTVQPALVRNAGAVRTFSEGLPVTREAYVGAKFAAIASLVSGMHIAVPDDSIVRGSVGEQGSLWQVANYGAKRIDDWVSYPPMFWPSCKEWDRGIECLNELAVQRAFAGDNPYDKSHEEIEIAVARLITSRLKERGLEIPVRVFYNTQDNVRRCAGDGSFQALDGSFPMAEEFMPDWLKQELEKFHAARR